MMIEVRDRLRATCMPPLKLVETLSEFAALQAPPPVARMPAAYVMPLGSRPSANGLTNAVRQRVEETVAVLLVTQNLTDPQGANAAAELVALYRTVRRVLVAWTPAPAWEQTLLGPARLLQFQNGVAYWQETYTSAYLERGTGEAGHG